MSRFWMNLAVALAIVFAGQAVQAQPAEGPGGRRGPGRGGFTLPPQPVIQALDANGDGEISAEEIQNAAAALKKLDENGDGKLAGEEVRPRSGGFGGGGQGRGGGIGRPGRPGGEGGVSSFESQLKPKTDGEKKILDVLDDLDRNQRRGMMNVPISDGRLLRLLAESIGARTVVEIGTSNGYSGIWFCLALRTTGGKLITHEIDARRASLARENFKRAGVDSMVTLVEGDAHEEAKKLKDPIDLLFLDADKGGYIDYLEKLLPLVKPGGLVVAHNINPRQADKRYIDAITTNPELETLFYMQGAGVSVTMKKR